MQHNILLVIVVLLVETVGILLHFHTLLVEAVEVLLVLELVVMADLLVVVAEVED